MIFRCFLQIFGPLSDLELPPLVLAFFSEIAEKAAPVLGSCYHLHCLRSGGIQLSFLFPSFGVSNAPQDL